MKNRKQNHKKRNIMITQTTTSAFPYQHNHNYNHLFGTMATGLPSSLRPIHSLTYVAATE